MDPAGTLTYAQEGAIFVTGAAIQWLRDGLGVIGSRGRVEALASTVPDSGGVVFVPALTGLGAPDWDPDRARHHRRHHPRHHPRPPRAGDARGHRLRGARRRRDPARDASTLRVDGGAARQRPAAPAAGRPARPARRAARRCWRRRGSARPSWPGSAPACGRRPTSSPQTWQPRPALRTLSRRTTTRVAVATRRTDAGEPRWSARKAGPPSSTRQPPPAARQQANRSASRRTSTDHADRGSAAARRRTLEAWTRLSCSPPSPAVRVGRISRGSCPTSSAPCGDRRHGPSRQRASTPCPTGTDAPSATLVAVASPRQRIGDSLFRRAPTSTTSRFHPGQNARTVSNRRSAALDAARATKMSSAGHTSPLMTVVLCLRDLSTREALAVGDAALRSGRVRLEEILTRVAQLRGPGSGLAKRRAAQLDANGPRTRSSHRVGHYSSRPGSTALSRR